MLRLGRPICFALAVSLLVGTGASAQEIIPTPTPLTERAPVVLDGRVLFEVGEAGTWSPQVRAEQINRRLRAAADEATGVPLEIAEHDGYPTIRMGEWHLLSVTDSDVPPGMEPVEQVQKWAQAIETALQQARAERTSAYRSSAWLRTLGVLLLAAFAHWLLSRAGRRVPLLLKRARWMRSRSPLGGQPGWQTAFELACLAAQAAVWIGAALWVSDRFPASRQVRWRAGELVGTGLGAPLFSLDQRSYSALDLLWLLGAVVVLWLVVGALTGLLSWRLQRATGASQGALQPVATLVRYALVLVGIIVILQVAGLNLSSLAIFASVLGVGIGFGLQSIANNFVSGLILSFEQPVKPGDFVSIGSLQGTVERIGGRSTIVRTQDRVSIIVPNANLLEHEVINWSYGDPLVRLHVPVGVAYGSDIQHVRGALLEAARSHPGVLEQPRPEVRLLSFGDNALNVELLVWSNDPPGQGLLLSDLNYQVELNLRRAGIDIPFPQRTLHVAPADVDAVVARLRGEPIAPAAPPPDAPWAAETVEAAAFPASSWGAIDLDDLVVRMRGPTGLAIEDRRHLLSVYPRCFVGTEAVDWLARCYDLSRDEAVRLGQALVERGVIHHVLDEHPFRDGNFYYRFYADEAADKRAS